MAGAATELSEREERFGEIAFAFLRECDEGRQPDPREWLTRYAEFGPELAGFFADQEEVDRLGAPLREMARAAERSSTRGPDTSAAGNDPVPPAALPRSFGDYGVLEEMARGGMGVVYRACQKSLNRLVALKVIRAGEWASAEEVRRFRNEAEMVALLDHPNIVPVHEVGEQAGQLYFSMKMIEGGSLAGQLARFRDDPRSAAGLLATVARAVHHAHQRGVLHRDLKPANILLDAEGRPHVTDFGLARRVEADSSLTQSGAIVGTPSYMAPEQATGRKAAVTTATDVYGLGAVLYALLTGRPPFQAESVMETLVQVREREPQPPSAVNRRVPRDLETICLKCLRKQPERRYASALALADDLERFLAGQPIRARPVGVWERGVKWARRRPLAVAALAGLVAALVLLGAGAGWVLGDRSGRQREAEGKVRESLDAAAPALEQGNPWDPALISAVQRAQAQLGSAPIDPGLRIRAEQLVRDVEMLRRLEKARLQSAAIAPKTGFDYSGANRLYVEAFDWYGLSVTARSPDDIAQSVGASAIGTHLITGLDDWAFTRDQLDGMDGKSLRALAALSDNDPWRRRLRDAADKEDRGALETLAQEEAVLNKTPADLVLLARALQRTESRAAAEQLLRHAQPGHPTDFWINFKLGVVLETQEAIEYNRAALAVRPQSAAVYNNLGNRLKTQGRLAEAEASLRRAIALQPDYARLHYSLADVLNQEGKLAEAVASLRQAIDLQPDFHEAYNNLAIVLRDQGKLAEAIAALQTAIKLKPASAMYRGNLWSALSESGQPEKALAACREALRINHDDPYAHRSMGFMLMEGGRLDEAIAEYRKAIRIKKDYAEAHQNLGTALGRKGMALGRTGLVDEAIAEFRIAISLNKSSADAHCCLGGALRFKGRTDEAIAEYQEAVRLKNDYLDAHYGLGSALSTKGRRDEAIKEFQETVRLKPDYAEAYCDLGDALIRQGRFAEGLAARKLGHELGSKRPGWHYPSAEWVRQAERLVELDAKLPRILKGEVQPADGAERLSLAQMCQEYKGLYHAAVRFYTGAFAEQPQLADDLQGALRYNAACAAALAGCGQGKDADQTDDKEHARLRRQALEWLRADLAAYRRALEKAPDKAGPAVRERMQDWQQDTDFAVVRGPDALAKLPEAERRDWQQLWQEVEALRKRAAKP